MSKRTAWVLLAGGLVVAVVAFYLGSAVFSGVFEREPAATETTGPAEDTSPALADPYVAWGFEPGTIAQSAPVVTPENAPLEYAPLDPAFLASLALPMQGQLTGTVRAVTGSGTITVEAQTFQVIDSTATPPVLRVLPAGSVMTTEWGPGVIAQGTLPEFAEGDFVIATITLDPAAGGAAGRVVIQSFERIPRSGSGSES